MLKFFKNNILIFFLLIQLIFLVYIVKVNLIYSKKLNKLDSENVYLKQEIKLMKEYNLYQYKNVGKKLDTYLEFRDRNGNSCDLNTFLNGVDYLLYFPQRTCPSCFENILKLIPEIREKLSDRLRIICSRTDMRNFTVYSQIRGKSEIVFCISPDILIDDMEALPVDVPCVLKITPDGKILSLFVVNKEYPEYLFDYFEVSNE